MGGFLSTRLTVESPDQFAGMSLLTPFFGLYDEKEFKRFLPLAKVFNKVCPDKLVRIRPPRVQVPHWAKHFDQDPLFLGSKGCAHNAV